MNKFIGIGRLVRDPEMRYNEKNSSCRFTIACDRPKLQGQKQTEADFINCVAWNKMGETIANYFSKGQRITVEGTLRIGSYENKQGQKVNTAEIWLSNFEFVESKGKSNGGGNKQSSMDAFGSADMEVDF